MKKPLLVSLLVLLSFFVPFFSVQAEAPEVSATPEVTQIPVVNPGVPLEEAKRNTLYFIGGMTLALAALVGVGYWKQRSEGKTPAMTWALFASLVGLNAFVLSNPLQTQAFCPVCTVAVGAGLGVSKSLGIDDVITSIWIGGLIVSMIIWLIEWLDKRKIRFLFRKPLIVFGMYFLVIWPLSSSQIIGTPMNTLWGVDKVLLGIIIGTFAFIFGYILNAIIVRGNEGKVYFPFQKVVFPISMLILFSLVFFFVVY